MSRWFLWGGLVLLLVGISSAFVFPAVQGWQRLQAMVRYQQPVIETINQRLVWVGERTLEMRSGGARWNKICPVVNISRLILMEDGQALPMEIEVLSGPFTGTKRDARYTFPTVPQFRPPSHFRMHLPLSADPSKAQFYLTILRVPIDNPCSDGWSGQQQIGMVTIPPKERAAR